MFITAGVIDDSGRFEGGVYYMLVNKEIVRKGELQNTRQKQLMAFDNKL